MNSSSSISDITYRKATIKDIDYIAEILVQAEKSDNEYSPMQIIFGLSSEEYFKLIKNVLEEEVPGSEYFYDNYVLVFVKNEFAGGIAVWIEGKGKKSSNFLKASLLSHYLGIEKWKESTNQLKLFATITHKRQSGILQIDSAFVVPKFQGNRLYHKLIQYGISLFLNDIVKIKKAQIVSIIENVKSVKSLQKFGFKIVNEKQSDIPELNILLSGTGFYQFELDLINYKNIKYD
ncbi:MAG: hypothetical protein HN704_03590 [Bacteroidetes bacterium]|jgi:hypothetical protein|nr:hypothetical protein [Bacteroidota bacterium]MBT6686697.1 hypothetical protein [Bacteroidota bacterium]MBT7141835.1 hypothetical protein [Bacteroidota bacterium]MBT7490674.1 hypothetical protein [Bacteroidota bacterium]